MLYINEIRNDLTSRMRLFADGSLLYGVMKSDADAQNLQGNLKTDLVNWRTSGRFMFNPRKSHVLSICRKNLPVVYS